MEIRMDKDAAIDFVDAMQSLAEAVQVRSDNPESVQAARDIDDAHSRIVEELTGVKYDEDSYRAKVRIAYLEKRLQMTTDALNKEKEKK